MHISKLENENDAHVDFTYFGDYAVPSYFCNIFVQDLLIRDENSFNFSSELDYLNLEIIIYSYKL